jgi:hypothetical protein
MYKSFSATHKIINSWYIGPQNCPNSISHLRTSTSSMNSWWHPTWMVICSNVKTKIFRGGRTVNNYPQTILIWVNVFLTWFLKFWGIWWWMGELSTWKCVFGNDWIFICRIFNFPFWVVICDRIFISRHMLGFFEATTPKLKIICGWGPHCKRPQFYPPSMHSPYVYVIEYAVLPSSPWIFPTFLRTKIQMCERLLASMQALDPSLTQLALIVD